MRLFTHEFILHGKNGLGLLEVQCRQGTFGLQHVHLLVFVLFNQTHAA